MRWIVTVLGVGYLRPAPGTWGSLAGVAMGVGIGVFGGWPLLLLAIPLVCMLGWFATDAYLKGRDKDPSEVVIDEVAGQWIALLPVLYTWGAATPTQQWTGVAAAFVLFRFFDIRKPWLVGWGDRQPGAFGVMADDVIAGFFAALILLIPVLLT
ncbi:MAG: phosphatidylglycerophosphatase A family protein [Shimia sp.]